MTLKGRGKLCGPQPDLKLISPLVKDLLRLVREAHSGNVFFILIAGFKVFWVEGIESPEDVIGSVLGFRVWPAVGTPRRLRLSAALAAS
jgi:hypothetical protein